jgi:hypothetical protein
MEVLLFRRKIWVALMESALIVTNTTGCASPSREESAGKKFDTYMEAWINRDIDQIWDAMSPKLKKGNGNSRETYRNFVASQNIYFSKYNRLETRVYGDRAYVIADMIITDSARTDTVKERQRCDLVAYSGSWYIDDCKPLRPAI